MGQDRVGSRRRRARPVRRGRTLGHRGPVFPRAGRRQRPRQPAPRLSGRQRLPPSTPGTSPAYPAPSMYRHTADTDFQSDRPDPSRSSPASNVRGTTSAWAPGSISRKRPTWTWRETSGTSGERAYGSRPDEPPGTPGPLGPGTTSACAARAFIGLNDRLALVPLAGVHQRGFHRHLLRRGRTAAGKHRTTRDRLVRLGAGLNFFMDADNLLLFSTEYLDGQVDHTIRDLDGDVDDFLAGRLYGFLDAPGLRNPSGPLDHRPGLDRVRTPGKPGRSDPTRPPGSTFPWAWAWACTWAAWRWTWP